MTSRRLFLIALALSLALHLALLGSGLLPQVSLELPPDPALRKIDVKLQALEMEPAAPAVQAGSQTASLVPVLPRKPKPASKKTEASQAIAKAEASAPIANASAPHEDVATASPAVKVISSMPAVEAIASAPAAATQAKATASSTPAAETSQDNRSADGYIRPVSKLGKFPHDARLVYQGFYGNLMAGRGEIHWQRDGDQYQLNVIFNPIFGPKLRYVSQGRLGKSGLLPDSLQAWRGDQTKESALFRRDGQILQYGGQAEKQVELKPGAQDVFSLPFQLGLKGGELGAAPIQITTGKKVYEYPMAPSGETDFDTGDGKIRVIVFRAQGDGDINEFWLAPDFSNLPVRILRIDKDKRIDLRAIGIEVDGTPQWQLPPQPTIRNKNEH